MFWEISSHLAGLIAWRFPPSNSYRVKYKGRNRMYGYCRTLKQTERKRYSRRFSTDLQWVYSFIKQALITDAILNFAK